MGKVILITGASRGIGLQLVKTVIEEDDECIVYGVARTEAGLQSLQREYGADKFVYRVLDITDRSRMEALVEEIRQKHGKLDGIVANAGMLEPVKSISQSNSEHDIKQWERLFDVNFFSIVSLVALCLPLLKSSPFVGNIVFVSSGASVKPYNGWSAYGCSKAALNHFAMDIASEEPSDKVRAVCIAPGVVDTQMQKDIRETLGPQGMTPKALERFTQLYKTSSLLDPKVPAVVLAQLVLKGIPDSLNGQYLRYNDERLGPVQG
ncbi:Irc24p [Saccharomyces cerevisiae YJM1460]|nr:Irc24p [Saccharomyces cerevisiae YJM1460]